MASKDMKNIDTFAPTLLPDKSTNKSILILTDNKVQELEFFYPYYRFLEEGYNVDIASTKGGDIKGEAGWEIKNTRNINGIDPADYELLYIPGGMAPKVMRESKELVGRVQQFAQSGKPIAAFCHGPQVLVTAGLVKGRKMTAYPEVQEEIEKAGGFYVDLPLVEDEQFITSRWPGDLPGHVQAILKRLKTDAAKGQEPARRAS